jgi:hypothetical protein
VLVLTEAQNSHAIHWTNAGIIKPAIAETAGTGNARRFSPLNVIEFQLAAEVAKFRVPAQIIGVAVNIFNHFHREAVAIYEESIDAPVVTDPPHLAIFRHAEARRGTAMNFFTRVWNSNNKNDRLASEKVLAIGNVWHQIRTGGFARGIPDPSWSHFLALFIAEEGSWAEVVLDPTPKELHDAAGGSAIVIDLANVVFRVGDRIAKLNGRSATKFELGAW